jgi:8-oxo-dGTP pyrophosphatase MutT (NUDIX family)
MASRGGQQHIPRPSGARPGGPPPWSTVRAAERVISLAHVRDRCARLLPPRSLLAQAPESRDAAVLIPIFEDAGAARVILTRRPDTMPSHQGEIAFPGGTVQPGVDRDARAAALREAEEEIGLAPATVEIVAELDTIGTIASLFVIAPFVGLLAGPPALRPDPREVDRVFDVSLAELLAEETYREEHWPLPGDDPRQLAELSVAFFELEGETIWGATARILRSFLAQLLDVEGDVAGNA